jgi:hypothetical protein
MGVARARYDDLIAAILSGNPAQVARLFHKYDRASPDFWAQPATSNTPDLSGHSGSFSPLWNDETAAGGSVIYDRRVDLYLSAYMHNGIHLRASRDLIHWSPTIAAIPATPAVDYYYPTLMGEAGDPTIGGEAPRVYFSAFSHNAFPDYRQATFEYVPLRLSEARQVERHCRRDR